MTAKTRIIATPAFKAEQDKLLAEIAQQRDVIAAAKAAADCIARKYIALLEAHYAPAFASV